MKCRRPLIGLLIVGLLAWANPGNSSPSAGQIATDSLDLPPGQPGERTEEFEFQGGERACIIVVGDHEPVVNVGIHIHDANKRLVAHDDGKGDFAAVIWYPPETGRYSITVTNVNSTVNRCFLVIR